MKQRLKNLVARIDVLSLRDRSMIFATAVAAIVFLLYLAMLNPLLAQRTALRSEIDQQRESINGIDRDIAQRMQAYALDPDAAARVRLAAHDVEATQLIQRLRAMQGGLVAPERIVPLLETILRANGRLQLLSLTTMPPAPVGSAAPGEQEKPPPQPGAAAPAAAPAAAADLLYRHGVELTVRGNYLDMINYMDALEKMPTQLFWGRAMLEVDEYPNARLTLTLYTLSLDSKWIRL
jgi:MSHA biogenesis protein MshJ